MTTSRLVKLCLFLVFSLADLSLTWGLVRHGGPFREANPVAGWWLDAWGWAGLAAFKGLTVLAVAALVLVISRHRPRAADRLLTFGCAAVGGILLYSSLLHLAGPGGDAEALARYHRAVARKIQLRREARTLLSYQPLMGRLSRDLVGRRRTLPEAARELARSPKGKDERWLAILRQRHPGHSDEQCLALDLVCFALCAHRGPPGRRQALADRLRAEFRACYGVAPRLPPDVGCLVEPAGTSRLARLRKRMSE